MSRWGVLAGRATGQAAHAARSAVSRRAAPFWAAAGAVAALFAVVAAAGGFERAEPTPTALAVGDEAVLSEYSITLLGAESTHEVEEAFLEADPGETILILTLRIENLYDRPIGVGQTVDKVESRLVNASEPLLTLPGITPTDAASVWRTDDSSGGVVLQPGVPSEVQIAWRVPEDALDGGSVTLDVYDLEITRGQIILSSDHVTWRRADLAARFTTEVRS